ncbi:MAG: CPBP family glutamic-type intramembrane protease [Aliishimia sp.]
MFDADLRSRRHLIAAAVFLILLMFFLVPFLTLALGPLHGFLACFLIYWLGFCIPVGVHFMGQQKRRKQFSLDVTGNAWVPWAVAIQITLVAVPSFMMISGQVSASVVFAAIGFGVVNGFLEEFSWRGAFLELGRSDRQFQWHGVGLFTLWHVPLAPAHGIVYPGGVFALISGALAMGAFWAFLAFRTCRIGWAIIGHISSNSIAFIGFFASNWC